MIDTARALSRLRPISPWGATQQATLSALAALGADDPDPTALSAHIATITTLLDTWRTVDLISDPPRARVGYRWVQAAA